jgi:rubrerythrin
MSQGRRGFLLGACGAGAMLAIGGCGGGAAALVHERASFYQGELRTVALAAAMENQAVAFYRALAAARHAAGVPALAQLAQTCLHQHAEHAATWNSLLRSARKAPVSGPSLDGSSLAGHAAVLLPPRSASPRRLAELAVGIEDRAARAYVTAAGRLTSQTGIAIAAGIAPVEAMHAAILRLMLGEYPVPGAA